MADSRLKYKVMFKKIKTAHEKLRVDQIIGYCDQLPEEGKQFFLETDPIESQSKLANLSRYMNTSTVKSVSREGNVFTLITSSNSIYSVTVLDSFLNK